MSCKQDVERHQIQKKKTQSTPVTVSINAEKKPVVKEIGLEQLSQVFKNNDILEVNYSKVVAISNLVKSPCPNSWENELSIAESIITRDSCLQDNTFMKEIQRRINLMEIDMISSSLALSGPYFEQRDNDSIIEVWINTNSPTLPMVIERLVEMAPAICRFHMYGDQNQTKQSLNRLGVVSIDKELSDMMREWSDTTTDIDKLIAILKLKSTNSEKYISLDSNNENIEELGIRSSPTWFVKGYRLRGLQSTKQINRIRQYP
jgi:hypothetical protein